MPCHNRYNFYSNWRKREAKTNPFYGKKHTPEARKAQRVAKLGKKSFFAGHEQSNVVKQLISQQNKGKNIKDRRKSVYIDSIYYESISEASVKTGLNRRLIRERCHSSDKRFQNYCWG